MTGIGHLGVPEGIVPFSEAYGANGDGTVIVGLSLFDFLGAFFAGC